MRGSAFKIPIFTLYDFNFVIYHKQTYIIKKNLFVFTSEIYTTIYSTTIMTLFNPIHKNKTLT